MIWRRKWQPTPVYLPGKSHGQRSTVHAVSRVGHNLATKPPTPNYIQSVQFSCSVLSDSLWPHESQHTRPPCPSPTPRVYPNLCPSSRWCHPAISSSSFPSPASNRIQYDVQICGTSHTHTHTHTLIHKYIILYVAMWTSGKNARWSQNTNLLLLQTIDFCVSLD